MLNKCLLDQGGALLWGEDPEPDSAGSGGNSRRGWGTASCPAQSLQRSCLFIKRGRSGQGFPGLVLYGSISLPGRKHRINHDGVATYLACTL